jgi:putative transcriptional regulator
LGQKCLVVLLGVLPVCCASYGLVCAMRCFSGFSQAEYFSLRTVKYLRGFAAGIFASVVTGVVASMLITVVSDPGRAGRAARALAGPGQQRVADPAVRRHGVADRRRDGQGRGAGRRERSVRLTFFRFSRVPIVVKLDVMLSERKARSKDLAAYVGITEANLSLLKQGKVKGVRFDTLMRICEFLNCQPGDLLVSRPDKAA